MPDTLPRLTPLSAHEQSAKVSQFKQGKRAILCCEGGGVRGIFTLQILKAFEEYTGARCIDIFDMFAGASTGAIIAGALAYGFSLDDLISLYRSDNREIFKKTALGWTRLIIPRYSSEPVERILKGLFADASLAECRRDILITAKDTVRGETTYFTAFHGPNDIRGTYQDVRLRDAIAASAASAPTYFKPFGRFIDGGIGSYNNVSYVAAVEALRYSARPVPKGRVNDRGERDPQGRWPVYTYPAADQLYAPGNLHVLSFGTGRQVLNMEPGEAEDIKTSIGWLHWIIGEGFDDANREQTYIAHEELDANEHAITFRDYQLNYTDVAVERLRAIDPQLPPGVEGRKLSLDSVDSFDFLDRLGRAFGTWLKQDHRFLSSQEFADPILTQPAKYHIDVYSKQVKDELRSRVR